MQSVHSCINASCRLGSKLAPMLSMISTPCFFSVTFISFRTIPKPFVMSSLFALDISRALSMSSIDRIMSRISSSEEYFLRCSNSLSVLFLILSRSASALFHLSSKSIMIASGSAISLSSGNSSTTSGIFWISGTFTSFTLPFFNITASLHVYDLSVKLQ